LYKRGIYKPEKGWFVILGKTVIAVTVMTGVLILLRGKESAWFHFSSLERLIRLTGIVALGIASYFGTLHILGFKIKDFVRKENNNGEND
jgi:putative peptidoglycan lipid II flippase